MNFRDFCCSPRTSFKDACIQIQFNDCRAVVVVSDNNKLMGVMSEGDIIRAFIEGTSPISSIENYYTRDPQKLEFNDPKRDEKFMKGFYQGVTVLPTVDKNGFLKSVVTINGEFHAT